MAAGACPGLRSCLPAGPVNDPASRGEAGPTNDEARECSLTADDKSRNLRNRVHSDFGPIRVWFVTRLFRFSNQKGVYL